MTARERSGKRLFLILATAMVLGNLAVAWQGVLASWSGFRWVIPLGLALAVPFLWFGASRLRWAIGCASIAAGVWGLAPLVPDLFSFDGSLWSIDPVGRIWELAGRIPYLVDLIGGLAFLSLPALIEFSQPQQRGSMANRGVRPVSLGTTRSPLRSALVTGLMTSGVCSILLVLVSALWGGFFGFHPAPIFGPRAVGWEGAASMALFSGVFLGIPVAVVGFVLGGVGSLFFREGPN